MRSTHRVLVLAVVILAGVSGARPAQAADEKSKKAGTAAFLSYVDRLNKRQWGRLYKNLYPGQQAQLALADFTACMDERPSTAKVQVDEVVEAYWEKATIPGTSDTVRTLALTIRATATSGGREQQITDTVHQIYADKRWRFALSADELANCT